MDQSNNAHRQPPRERFAQSEVQLDLAAAAQRLLDEPHEGQRGHRQIALYKTHHTTLALFAFDACGSMPEHRTAGAVIIHTLQGRLRVRTPEDAHVLAAGQVLVLAPGVPHDVVAEEASQMLLTVSMVAE
ncbi:MAG: cupin domain-containing protein [Fimbriimonas sp.]